MIPIIVTQVYASTVKLLTDAQLEELGVELMGDRAALRDACARSIRSEYAIVFNL